MVYYTIKRFIFKEWAFVDEKRQIWSYFFLHFRYIPFIIINNRNNY